MADNDIHEREGVNSSNTNHFYLQTFRRQSIDEKKTNVISSWKSAQYRQNVNHNGGQREFAGDK